MSETEEPTSADTVTASPPPTDSPDGTVATPSTDCPRGDWWSTDPERLQVVTKLHPFWNCTNGTIEPRSCLYYPKGELEQDPRLKEAFEEFEASEPGFVKERRELEAKGWVTRVLATWYVSGGTAPGGFRVSDVDYHTPAAGPASSVEDVEKDLHRPRPSTMWRMISDKLLTAALTPDEWRQTHRTPPSIEELTKPSKSAAADDLKATMAAGAGAVTKTSKAVYEVVNYLEALDGLVSEQAFDFEAGMTHLFQPVDTWRSDLMGLLTKKVEDVKRSPGRDDASIILLASLTSFIQDDVLKSVHARWPDFAAERDHHEAQGYTIHVVWDDAPGAGPGEIKGIEYVPTKLTSMASLNTPFKSAYSPALWQDKLGLPTIPPDDIELDADREEHMFWPHGPEGSVRECHSETFEAFVRSVPGLQDEIDYMEGKGWVTRAVLNDDRSNAEGGPVSEIVHVDYHLPLNCKPSAGVKTSRPSLIWRKMRTDRLLSGRHTEPMALSAAEREIVEVEVQDQARKGYLVSIERTAPASLLAGHTDEYRTIKSLDYAPGKPVSFRRALKAIPSAVSPQLRKYVPEDFRRYPSLPSWALARNGGESDATPAC